MLCLLVADWIAGNVVKCYRFEEGRSSYLWAVSCCELLESRWHGAAGLRRPKLSAINRIVRIHNRFLRSRYALVHECLVTSFDGDRVSILHCQ